MPRASVLLLIGFLLLGMEPAHGSPVRGQYLEPQLNGNDRSVLNAGVPYDFFETFRGNERACIIVEGDHKPPVNLSLKVFDAADNLVASYTAGGDLISVVWYPPTTQRYRVSIASDSEIYNQLEIIVK